MVKKTPDAFDFQAKSTELDGLLIKLQDPEVPVDIASEYYQRGLTIIHELEDYLEHAENSIQKLTDASE